MMEPKQKPTQRDTWKELLVPGHKLIMRALEREGIPDEQVVETWFRWDMPDLTVAWPKTEPNRMIHAWLIGEWPRYEVWFEGAAWKDDEYTLERKVVFGDRFNAWIMAAGQTDELPTDIFPDNIRSRVFDLVKFVNDMSDSKLDMQHSWSLQPVPSSRPTIRSRRESQYSTFKEQS